MLSDGACAVKANSTAAVRQNCHAAVTHKQGDATSGSTGSASPGRLAELEAENAELRADLADALAEAERLAVQQCRHPAAAVDSGTCHACGADMW
jgi:hypothetical protein